MVGCYALEETSIDCLLCELVGRRGQAWSGLGQIGAKVSYKAKRQIKTNTSGSNSFRPSQI